MPITTSQLISQAFHVAGIFSRDFQSVPGNDVEFGLQVLNDLLGQKLIDDKYLPYYTKYEFTAVIGQKEYFIPNLISMDTFVFFIQTVRFATRNQDRRDFRGSSRAENVESLPYQWNLERTLNGANLSVYFLPDQNYPCEIWGKFGLEEVTELDLDLLTIYDRYYLKFLKYELAEQLCAEYNMDFPLAAIKMLDQIRSSISKKSAKLDLTLQSVSTLGAQSSLSYAQVNLGRGFTTPGY